MRVATQRTDKKFDTHTKPLHIHAAAQPPAPAGELVATPVTGTRSIEYAARPARYRVQYPCLRTTYMCAIMS